MHNSVKRRILAAVTSLLVSVSVLGIGEGLKYRYQWYRYILVSV